MAAANVEVINRKCHDLKHQISALRQMDNPEEKVESIQELERAVLNTANSVAVVIPVRLGGNRKAL
mgnify:CR=1 FL=1